jgi:hypothetical protein
LQLLLIGQTLCQGTEEDYNYGDDDLPAATADPDTAAVPRNEEAPFDISEEMIIEACGGGPRVQQAEAIAPNVAHGCVTKQQEKIQIQVHLRVYLCKIVRM